MNCSDWQMRIATEEAGPEVERHLAECGECRAFVSDLAAIADGMRAMDADAASYAAVRARVRRRCGRVGDLCGFMRRPRR
jgi:predicted anti-sigma-YlaC factor YlaD